MCVKSLYRFLSWNMKALIMVIKAVERLPKHSAPHYCSASRGGVPVPPPVCSLHNFITWRVTRRAWPGWAGPMRCSVEQGTPVPHVRHCRPTGSHQRDPAVRSVGWTPCTRCNIATVAATAEPRRASRRPTRAAGALPSIRRVWH